MTDSPGLVGVIAQETARYTMFAASLTATELPEGSEIRWRFGHTIPENCNALVRDMLAGDYEWLWILGDDHAWSPNLLMKLLAHEEHIVVPLCMMRTPPYKPVIYSGEEPVSTDGENVTVYRKRVDLDQHPFGGLIPVHSAGSGGMLINRAVFEMLPDPWFETGKLDSETLSEDIYFCDKARAVGFDVFCDLDAHLGHCMNGVVWPVKSEQGWTFGFSTMGGFQIIIPPSMQQLADEAAGR